MRKLIMLFSALLILSLFLVGCAEQSGLATASLEKAKVSCGDGICQVRNGESTVTCQTDCGSRCGDGVCRGIETSLSCSQDCLPTKSNDVCESGENVKTEPACGLIACGNGICQEGENVKNCVVDCDE